MAWTRREFLQHSGGLAALAFGGFTDILATDFDIDRDYATYIQAIRALTSVITQIPPAQFDSSSIQGHRQWLEGWFTLFKNGYSEMNLPGASSLSFDQLEIIASTDFSGGVEVDKPTVGLIRVPLTSQPSLFQGYLEAWLVGHEMAHLMQVHDSSSFQILPTLAMEAQAQVWASESLSGQILAQPDISQLAIGALVLQQRWWWMQGGCYSWAKSLQRSQSLFHFLDTSFVFGEERMVLINNAWDFRKSRMTGVLNESTQEFLTYELPIVLGLLSSTQSDSSVNDSRSTPAWLELSSTEHLLRDWGVIES